MNSKYSKQAVYKDGKFRIQFDPSGFRKLSFRKYGVMEEGLELVFRHKEVTAKSLLRIEGLVQEFETTLKKYFNDPTQIHLFFRLKKLMKQLCGKIGQLDNLVSNHSPHNELNQLARHALELIRDHCNVKEFKKRAEKVLDRIELEASEVTGTFHRTGLFYDD